MLFFCSNWGLSKSFNEINDLTNNEIDKRKVNSLLKEEKKIYQSTGNLENLLNIKFLRFLYLRLNNGTLSQKLTILFKLEQESESANFHLMHVRVLDELSVLVNTYSKTQGAYYNFKLLEQAKKYKFKDFVIRGYSQIATFYTYSQVNYDVAIKYWDSCYSYQEKNNFLQRASMLNNISLCYDFKQDLSNSILYNRKAYSIFQKIRHKSNSDIFFGKIIEGNYADLIYKKGKKKEAQKIFETLFKDFKKKSENNHVTIYTAINLLRQYENSNQYLKLNETLRFLEIQLQVEKDNNIKIVILEALYNYYENKSDFKRASDFAKELLRLKDTLTEKSNKDKEEFSEIMTNNLINSLKKNIDKENESQRRRNNILIISLVFIVLALGIVIYYQLRVRLKTKKIEKQTLEIEEKNQQIIDKELKLQQEKITHLQLNLNLKTGAEKAFLQKLKEIKKKNNQSIEEVVNDLQFQISNLLQIDKKNYETNTQLKNEEKLFYDKLKARHQELSKIDIQFCSYFRIDLSSKEIALLEDIAPNSVRVYKNRIKNKIGLSVDDNLNEYLKKI